MRLSALQAEVLDLGIDDYYGLYEVVWMFRTLFPDKQEQELETMAQNAVRDLLQMGLIQLYYYDGRSNSNLIASEEIEEVLSKAQSWQPSALGTTGVWYAATEKGEQRYYRGNYDSDRK
jgi:hypothetical protein